MPQRWWDESEAAGVRALDWSNTAREMLQTVQAATQRLEEARQSAAAPRPAAPAFPSLDRLLTGGGSWSEPEDEATTDPFGFQSLDALTSAWFPKQQQQPQQQTPPTPSGTPAAMPQAPGLVPATITSGPRPGQTLQPGESVGSVTLGPPSGPPSDSVLRWSANVDKASAQYGVPREIIMGIMDIESGGRTHDAQGRPLRSAAGATSLMQVMPFHFQAGEDPDDPDTNIGRGAKILADNYRRYGDWDRAAAAYFGAIDENGNITDATDATGTNGSKYVALFRGAASKYGPGAQTYPDRGQPAVRQDVPTAPSTAPQASDARTYPERPAAPATGPKLRVRDKWGNEFEMTQDDLNRRPGGSADLTIIGPVAMNAGASSPQLAPAAAAPGGAPPAAGAGALPPTVAQKWRQQFGRDPSPEEAAELMGVLS